MHHSFNSTFKDSGLDTSFFKITPGNSASQKENLQSKTVATLDDKDTFSTYNSSTEFSSSEQEIHVFSSEETCDNHNKLLEREYNEAVQTGACLRLYDAAINRRKRLDSKSRGRYTRKKKIQSPTSNTYATRAQAKQTRPTKQKCENDKIQQHPSNLDTKSKKKEAEMNCYSTSFTIKKVHSVHKNIMTCNSQEQGIEVALLSDDIEESLLRVLAVKTETTSQTSHESQIRNVVEPLKRLTIKLINEKRHEESGNRLYEKAVQSQKALQKKIAMAAKEEDKMLREKRRARHVNRHSERILARKSDQSYNKTSFLSKVVRSNDVDFLIGNLMESINTFPEEHRAETLKKVLHEVL